MNDWIIQNYSELLGICRKVSKQYDCWDLFQVSIEQFMLNKRIGEIQDDRKLYFFTGIVKNNWYSEKSKYGQTYKKYKFVELTNEEFIDSTYTEPVGLEWVRNQIQELKKSDWYYARLFEMYIEEGCSIVKLSQRTTIPQNSVSRDIKKIRNKLIELRKKYNDGLQL